MLKPLALQIEGLAWWSPDWPDWPQARAALHGEPAPPGAAARRPAPAGLSANERRRAPESVLMALQVAEAACAQAGREPRTLPSVFASAHGDLPIVDALCRTLASDPALLSPLRFHHSVHNAASGYWAIASGCTEASTALAAGEASFAAGLLEAACQCVADARPVLLVAFDTAAPGPLQTVHGERQPHAVALVLAPGRSGARPLALALQDGPAPAIAPRPATSPSRPALALADAWPLFEALSDTRSTQVALALTAAQHLLADIGPA